MNHFVCHWWNLMKTIAACLGGRQNTLFFVGDEVTSLESLLLPECQLETPHVVTYVFEGLPVPSFSASCVRRNFVSPFHESC